MTTPTTSQSAAPAVKALVLLLALVVLLNYVDRGTFNITAPLIKDQLHLSATEIGILMSAFFWSYVPAQIVTGWMTERYSTALVLGAGLTLWAVATACLGLSGGFFSFLCLRLLLGVGESVAFPCSSKLLAQYVPQDQLGRANGLIGVGMALGPGCGTLLGGLLMAQQGWRSVFVFFGLVSLLWLVPWLRVTRNIARLDSAPATGGRPVATIATISTIPTIPTMLQLLHCRDLWGACLGHFCANYAFYFIIAWLPLYLVKERGMSIESMAQLGGVIYATYAVSAYCGGLVTDRLIHAGVSVNRVRKGFIIASLSGIAFCLMLVGLGDATVSMAGLLLVGLAMGMGMPNIYAASQTIAGPPTAGKWMGIQNSVANIAGVVVPLVTGRLIDLSGHFQWAFIVAALVALVGITGHALVLRKVTRLDWDLELRRPLAG